METYRMLGFVDEVKAAGSIVMPMQQYDTEGRPSRLIEFTDHVDPTPGAPEVCHSTHSVLPYIVGDTD